MQQPTAHRRPAGASVVPRSVRRRRAQIVGAATAVGLVACFVVGIVYGDEGASSAAETTHTESSARTTATPAATPQSAAAAAPATAPAAAQVAATSGEGDGIAPPLDQALSAAVTAQMQYVYGHWNSYNLEAYGSLDDNDCANFASQSLIARGWTMTDDWWAAGTGSDFDFSKAWVSSTALMNYLSEHPELATALDDTQRAQVKVGDIVQFDWDRSGDRDHTGIVTAVTHTATGIDIRYAAHTDDTVDRSVDWAIHTYHPGAAVYYWSIH